MHPGIYFALSGSLVQEERLKIVTNNLANADTPGYKKDVSSFHQYLLSVLGKRYTDFSPGLLKPTKNPLDLAIEGNGFFTISTPMGIRYTRRGDFSLNSKQILVTKDNYPVLGKKGPIVIKGSKVSIDTNGNVWVDGRLVDTLKIVAFPKGTKLKKEGGGIFAAEAKSAGRPSSIIVHQGFLESANVNVIENMINMIEIIRTYEACQKVIQSLDETDNKAINEIGRVS